MRHRRPHQPHKYPQRKQQVGHWEWGRGSGRKVELLENVVLHLKFSRSFLFSKILLLYTVLLPVREQGFLHLKTLEWKTKFSTRDKLSTPFLLQVFPTQINCMKLQEGHQPKLLFEANLKCTYFIRHFNLNIFCKRLVRRQKSVRSFSLKIAECRFHTLRKVKVSSEETGRYDL